jgi:hypothetical protein
VFLTTKKTLGILLRELHPLVERGGVHYDVFDKLMSDEEKKKTVDDKDVLKYVVVYFEDSFLDLMAEVFHVKTRLSNFDCMVDFKCFAEDFFEPFNSRQVQSIILQTFEQEFDLKDHEKSQVIIDHFPLHQKERDQI